MSACDACLRRTGLIAAIAGRLQVEFKQRGAPARVLALSDEDLLAVGASDDIVRRYAGFDASAARERAHAPRAHDPVPVRGRVPGAAARPRGPAGRAAHPR